MFTSKLKEVWQILPYYLYIYLNILVMIALMFYFRIQLIKNLNMFRIYIRLAYQILVDS